jgi:hypothetical protein
MGMAKRKTSKPVTVEHRSLPTRERMARADGNFEIGGDDRSGKVIRIMDAPLDRMRSRRMIGPKEYEALNKYRIHWWHAGMSGHLRSPELDRIFTDPLAASGMASTERQAHHRSQFRKARALFATPDNIASESTENHKMLIVLDNVLLSEQSLEIAGYAVGCKSRFRARERSKDLLCKAADILANYWKL